ncbi:hypothetical protein A2V68_01210 [candidate division Kazan bacterium RBG_13_50_9]|uniref:Lycopene cyclase domain-containing protein n=1 Tax=candidate division Kazan bacterium RBG_13_50_9 TaxID=1798535 RepID=A0A1F4NS85_UNCK3|nr:MAG: hypothetical protein A2V68_01210 [candidate division Kazan bacterium RBG_13_50_9]
MVYLYWLALFALLPNLILWLWQPRMLWHHRYILIKIAVVATLVAMVWDALAIHVYGIWSFPQSSVVGWALLDIPLEQYLFYILVSWLVAKLTLIVRQYD